MADLDLASAAGDWPAFFRQRVAAGTCYWLDQLTTRTPTDPALRDERHNIVKALSLALQCGAAWEPALDLLVAYHPYVNWQGHWQDWETFLQAGLEISRQQGNVTREAVLLEWLGELKRQQGDLAAAAACHQAAYERNCEIGDQAGCARALTSLGYVYRLQERYQEAQYTLERALAVYQAAGDGLKGQAFCHYILGMVYLDQRQLEQAMTHYRQAHRLWADLENVGGMAQAEHKIGDVLAMQGDWLQAEQHYHAAIALLEQTGAQLHLADVSLSLGNLYLHQGQPERAETFYRRAREVMQAAGFTFGLAQVLNNLGMACRQQQRWAAAEECFHQSIGLWRQMGRPVSQANAEDNLAETYLHQRKWSAAQAVLALAQERLSQAEPTPRVTSLLAEVVEHLQAARAGLAGAEGWGA